MLVARYQTKADLKRAIGERLNYVETSMFSPEYQTNGSFSVVGPEAYRRVWYAQVTMIDDRIAMVDGSPRKPKPKPMPLARFKTLGVSHLKPFKSCCKLAAQFGVVCRDCNKGFAPYARLEN